MTSTSAGRPDTTDLTDDAFLGGQLRLLQPRKGYRAGVDPVLLAASVNALAGDTVSGPVDPKYPQIAPDSPKIKNATFDFTNRRHC